MLGAELRCSGCVWYIFQTSPGPWTGDVLTGANIVRGGQQGRMGRFEALTPIPSTCTCSTAIGAEGSHAQTEHDWDPAWNPEQQRITSGNPQQEARLGGEEGGKQNGGGGPYAVM